MKRILESGQFSNYREGVRLDSASMEVANLYKSYFGKTTVFISHKHDDLEDLSGLIGFLEKNYNVKTYIDSKDSSMPSVTSGVTASKIKERIRQCDKFILLATDGAVESKWCNWELGYGDSQEFSSEDIAILPLKRKGYDDSSYKGNEYMQIYPYIAYYDGTEFYRDRTPVQRGYYVVTEDEKGNRTINPLRDWLNNH